MNTCRYNFTKLKICASESISKLHPILSGQLIGYQEKRAAFGFENEGENVIFCPENLLLILDCWSLWKEADPAQFNEEPLTCAQVLLSCLQTLLQDSQPFRDVNVQVLRHLKIIPKLAFLLKKGPVINHVAYF